MPRILSSTAIAEKNKLASGVVWLLMLEITIPGVSEPVRVVANNEDVTWRGYTWQKFRFEMEPVGEESKGEVPQLEIRVSNVNRLIEVYLQNYDSYCKTNGISPITLNIYVVLSNNLGNTTPEAEYLYDLKKPKADEMWATFVLGATNTFNRRYPVARLQKNTCQYRKYNYPAGNSSLCGASSAYTTCDRTLSACRTRNNSIRFGGSPGVGAGGIRLG